MVRPAVTDGGVLLEIGERAVNLARMFNVREGIAGADDHLATGVPKQPLQFSSKQR